MRLRPISLREARRFIAKHHRHNEPTVGWKAGVGLDADGQLLGVGVLAHYPTARALMKGYECEITRVCTDGTPNACSMLYGALCRAAEGLGFDKVYTYTTEVVVCFPLLGLICEFAVDEQGASVRAAGFVLDGETPAGEWGCPSRPRHQTDLFGNDRRPPGRKKRWRRDLRSQRRKGVAA